MTDNPLRAMAQRHVVEGFARIGRQKEIIRRLEAGGHSDKTLQQAYSLLEVYREAQKNLIEQLARLKK